MSRYLTKSRFLLGINCPAKLFYTGKERYPDANMEDSFLEALAEGGYQVGALAKCYYPDGIEIIERGYEMPIQRTKDLMTQENIVIFEAAFLYNNLLIRADIIEKKGTRINLLEVKAKSFEGNDSIDMLSKGGYLDSKWEKYVYDVAFQKYVIMKSNPEYDVHAYLILANKNAVATVDGLNQKFQLKTVEDERTEVEIIGDVSRAGLGYEVLIRVSVDDLIDRIYAGTDTAFPEKKSFIERIQYFADMYERDEKIITPIHKDCKSCEFKSTPEQEQEGKLSGFKECWSNQLGWGPEMFANPLILDIWDYRNKQKLMDEGKYLMRDVTIKDIGQNKLDANGGLSRNERQWLQVRKLVDKDHEPYIDIDGLKAEFETFNFPLHFIDFETSMVAIPFYKGRKPYEQTAFQFSHHVVYSDMRIEHFGQYICREKGMFPNFEFVKKLKAELEHDDGSVFRYADHENTVLNQILIQLQAANTTEVPEKPELIAFIESITHSANQEGDRDMIDLLKLVKKYYYHPLMGGSNSIKAVLPAVLSSSEYIQNKYSKPVYGKNSEIKSLNFEDGWVWIKKDGQGNIISPYKLLPSLFENVSDDQIEEFMMRSDIQDGGAAMTAYAKMQFMEISEAERDLIVQGLLKYCELDTLAMVMIWEYWNSEINRNYP